MSLKNLCPVCGFDGLEESPYNKSNQPSYEICPCCGFEFGFDRDDDLRAFDVFRKAWIEKGACWFIPRLKPKCWSLKKQLAKLNI